MTTPAHPHRNAGTDDDAAALLQRQLRDKIRPRLLTIIEQAQLLAETDDLDQSARSIDAIATAAQRIATAIDDMEADAIRDAATSRAAGPATPSARRTNGATVDQAAQRPRNLLRGSLEVRTAGQLVTCRVELLRDKKSFRGQADELDTPGGRARASARATLIAAQQAVPGTRLALENVAAVNLATGRYIAVAIEAGTARLITQLAGIARLDRSHEETACLAALNAIERWTGAPAHRSRHEPN